MMMMSHPPVAADSQKCRNSVSAHAQCFHHETNLIHSVSGVNYSHLYSAVMFQEGSEQMCYACHCLNIRQKEHAVPA